MKYVLLSGASSDIGSQIAMTISKNHSIILTGRNLAKLQTLLSKLHNQDKHQILIFDLKDIANIKNHINSFLKLLGGGGITDFIHCGGEASFGRIKNFDYNQSIESFNINFFSCCEIISVLLKKTNQDYLRNIILISSISAIRGYKGSSIYAASKACLDSLTRTLCDELSPKVKINSIQLGNIATSGNIYLNHDALAIPPIGEGKCEDVALLVEFLLSDSSKWINGQNIILDGGKSAIGQ